MTAAILLVGALVLVPGIGAALAFAAPGQIGLESRVALAFGFGYAVVAGTALLLTLAHIFMQPTFIVGVVLATAGVWVLALRRASLRQHYAALAAQTREAPYIVGVGLVLLLAVAVSRLFYPQTSTLAIRSAWRYWADGLQIEAVGHVPSEARHWGTEIPTTVSKVALNSFEAGIATLLGPEPLPAMKGILLVAAVGVVAALLAFGRELGLGIFAPLVPVLIVLVPEWLPLSHEMSNDLKWYTAEDLGRLAAFAGLVAGIHAVRTGRWLWPAVVTGVLLAIAGLTHLVPTLIAGALLTLFAVGLLLVKRVGLRATLIVGAATIVAFLVAYVGSLGLSGGDLGFQVATSGAKLTGFEENVDPTRSFEHGEYVPPKDPEGAFLVPPREMLGRYAEDTIERPGRGWYAVAGLALLLAATIVAVIRVRDLLPAGIVAWGLLATILIATFYFSLRFDTQIPGGFGRRRLYDYSVMPPAIAIATALAGLTVPLMRRYARAAPVTAIVVGLLALVAVADRTPRDRSLPRANAGLAVARSVAEYVPCDARMLANARTSGFWEATTGRPAITEGMAPYLRPAVIRTILPVLVGANEFWAEPAAKRSFLDEQDVDYLVVVAPKISFGWGGSGRITQPEDADNVAALPDVQEVYRDERVAIFAVGDAPVTQGGQPERCNIYG